jgi:hypothetical protein
MVLEVDNEVYEVRRCFARSMVRSACSRASWSRAERWPERLLWRCASGDEGGDGSL